MVILEEQREIKVTNSCDVLVVGGGVAGISAALSAARHGADVILLERAFSLGGLATLGLITIFLPLCDGEGEQVIFGIGEELFRLSICHGAEKNYPKAWLENGTKEEKLKARFEVQYNPHLFALEAEKLLVKEGVRILYGTVAAAVKVLDNKITGVVTESISGREAIKAKSVVDATGDAIVAHLSGAKTADFKQKNLLAAWYYSSDKTGIKLHKLGVSDIPDEYKKKEISSLSSKRFTGLNSEELSEMMVMSHQNILNSVVKYKESNLDFWPVTIPSIPQVRMTRRLEGAALLDDKNNRKTVPSSIGLTGDWRKKGPVFEIPFEALYASEIKNLIAAGRCISVTDSMWDITRVIPCCAVTGEAAGAAAAMTDDFTTLPVEELQRVLAESGVKLHVNS